MKYFLMDIAGSLYETVTLQNHTQRLIRRKVGNVFRRLKGEKPLRSWQDGRVNTVSRAPIPSDAECERLNFEAGRSV